jgi:hypothetical protein
MKDERVKVFRRALQELIESLDAMVRVRRWAGPEAAPEPLQESASRLLGRLGTAGRLAAGTFNGSPADALQVEAMCSAMRRLDAAYVAYRQAQNGDHEASAMTLNGHIEDVTAEAARWEA